MKESDTILKCAEERVLFFLHDLHDEFLLCCYLWEGFAHLLDESGNKLVDEGFFLAEEGIAVAYCAAEDASDDISCLCIGWKLAVCYSKSYGTEVVNDDAHGYVLLLVVAILAACHVAQHLDEWLENVSVVVGCLALECAHEAFEAHACIYNFGRKAFEASVGLAVELHEDEVPYLDDLRMVFVDKFTSWCLCLLFL